MRARICGHTTLLSAGDCELCRPEGLPGCRLPRIALEETNRELADALEAIRKQIAVTRDVPSDDLARYVDEWDDAVQRIDEICTETLGKAGRS